MSRSALDLIQAFAQVFRQGNAQSLALFLDEDVCASFAQSGALAGRRTVVDFWRRLFERYSEIDVRIGKLVTEGSLVIGELSYTLKTRSGRTTYVRTVSVFEIKVGLILNWVDHADLAAVPDQEKELWRRLGAARW